MKRLRAILLKRAEWRAECGEPIYKTTLELSALRYSNSKFIFKLSHQPKTKEAPSTLTTTTAAITTTTAGMTQTGVYNNENRTTNINANDNTVVILLVVILVLLALDIVFRCLYGAHSKLVKRDRKSRQRDAIEA